MYGRSMVIECNHLTTHFDILEYVNFLLLTREGTREG